MKRRSFISLLSAGLAAIAMPFKSKALPMDAHEKASIETLMGDNGLILEKETLKTSKVVVDHGSINLYADVLSNPVVNAGDVLVDVTTRRYWLPRTAQRYAVWESDGKNVSFMILDAVPCHGDWFGLTKRQRACGNEFMVFKRNRS